MAEPDEFWVRFWGVRGSIACPGGDTLRYGGNTACLEVRCGAHLLIFDCGTGARGLGKQLQARGPVDADIFLSHTHFDHICGVPFFEPAFKPGNGLRLWAGHLKPENSVREVIRSMMTAPLFPVPLRRLPADITYNDFEAGATLTPKPGVVVSTAPLNHPGGATGYRVEFAGRSICYVTDTEHAVGTPDRNVLELIEGSDIVIYDATYTDEEFTRFKGWGHSTWQEGARLCEAARVKTYVVFHHEPDHDDSFMDRIADEVAHMRAGAIVAREGLVLRP
ncbi:MAG: MBL fold metallo-hydrolase [Alphaproteobacteria bacterium]